MIFPINVICFQSPLESIQRFNSKLSKIINKEKLYVNGLWAVGLFWPDSVISRRGTHGYTAWEREKVKREKDEEMGPKTKQWL